MKVITLVVAALLLTTPGSAAAAEATKEHTSKHAQKVIVLLNSMGINSKEVKEFVTKVDAEVDVKNGYLNFAQRELPGGHKIALRYRISNKHHMRDPRSSKRFELALTPSPTSTFSNFEMIARTDSFTVNYRLKF